MLSGYPHAIEKGCFLMGFTSRRLGSFFIALIVTVLSMSLALAAEVSVFGPQTVSPRSFQSSTFNYQFPGQPSVGKIKLIYGDGSDLNPEICSGSIKEKVTCQVKNTLKLVAT